MGWLKKRLPKKRWKRVFIYLLSAAAILVAGDMVLVQCWRRIEISPETTRVTSPLTAEGLPDYVAARNAAASEGVTAENNAAPELLALSAEGQMDYMEWLKGHAAAGTDYTEEWDATVRKPWKSSDHPVRAEWFNRQRETLIRLDGALTKDRFYVPWTSAEPGAITGELLPWLRCARLMSYLLAADAMRAAGDGDAGTFRRDVVDIAKLARVTGQGSTLIEYLVAIAIDGEASSALQRGAAVGFLKAEEGRPLLKEWTGLAAMADGSGAFDVGERFLLLSAFCSGSRVGLRGAMGGPPNRMGSLFVPVHYNAALKKFNRFFDGLVAADRLADYRQRSEAVGRVVSDAENPGWLSIGDLMLATLAPSLGRTFALQERTYVGRDLATVTLALRVYREEHGGFPPALGGLSPGILSKVPADGFVDGALQYRREAKGYVLYSVGEDGKDDGGLERKDRKAGGGYDIVVRAAE